MHEKKIITSQVLKLQPNKAENDTKIANYTASKRRKCHIPTMKYEIVTV